MVVWFLVRTLRNWACGLAGCVIISHFWDFFHTVINCTQRVFQHVSWLARKVPAFQHINYYGRCKHGPVVRSSSSASSADQRTKRHGSASAVVGHVSEVISLMHVYDIDSEIKFDADSGPETRLRIGMALPSWLGLLPFHYSTFPTMPLI